MKTLTIASLQRPLTVLDVARENLRSTKAKLLTALAPYDNERRELERKIHELNEEIDATYEASRGNPTVTTLTDEYDEWQRLHFQAMGDVKTAAHGAWFIGNTSGAKQWRQGEWEIKLRMTSTPVVTIPLDFLSHLEAISAEGIVKNVNFTLNKKATVELNERVGLSGLKIDKKTSVSVTKVKED